MDPNNLKAIRPKIRVKYSSIVVNWNTDYELIDFVLYSNKLFVSD